MSLEKPRFRRDLEAVPVEADGQSYVNVRDPRTGTHFSFYDFEYRVALAFDGLPLATVIPWVKLSTGLELTETQLSTFAERLHELGFLDDGTPPQEAAGPSDVKEAAEVSESVVPVAISSGSAGEEEPEVLNAGLAPPSAVDAEALRPSDPMPERASPPAESPPPSPSPTPPPAAPRPHLTPPPAESPPPPPSTTPSPVVPRPQLTPPPAPWATPRPLVTLSPTTSSTGMIEQPSSRRRLRRSLVLFGSLGVLAAAAVVAVLVPFVLSPQAAPHARVRVLRAAPTTVLRFFEASASLHPVPGALLRFPAAGKVARIAAAGAALADGDVAASLEGQSSKSLLDKLASQRERLAFARQMAEGMHQAGNLAEEERHSSKVESRQIQVEKTLAELKQVAVVALAPGIVDQALASVGQDVDAGSPAIRLRSSGLRASFALTRPQMASARKLPFCLLDIDGDVVDCNLREGADEAHVDVDVDLGAVPPSLLDKPAKLARARYEAAVMVPATVVLHSGNHDEVWLVSPPSRLEARAVTVAERDASVAVVVQGLDPDDRIVVEGPASLRPGQAVVVR